MMNMMMTAPGRGKTGPIMMGRLCALCAVLVACAPDPSSPPAVEGASEVVLQKAVAGDAFVIEPAGARTMTMGGVRIQAGPETIRLVGASAPQIGAIELHTTAVEDGMMKMRQVDGLTIAAGKTLVLQRGGAHLMMFGVDKSVTTGQDLALTLLFDTAGGERFELTVPAVVRSAGAPPAGE